MIYDTTFLKFMVVLGFTSSCNLILFYRYFHRNSSIKELANTDKMLKCSTCKTFCTNENQLKLHKELYCDVGFECKQCSERFARISSLSTHMKLSHGANVSKKKRETAIATFRVFYHAKTVNIEEKG